MPYLYSYGFGLVYGWLCTLSPCIWLAMYTLSLYMAGYVHSLLVYGWLCTSLLVYGWLCTLAPCIWLAMYTLSWHLTLSRQPMYMGIASAFLLSPVMSTLSCPLCRANVADIAQGISWSLLACSLYWHFLFASHGFHFFLSKSRRYCHLALSAFAVGSLSISSICLCHFSWWSSYFSAWTWDV